MANGHLLQRIFRPELPVALGTTRTCMFRIVVLVILHEIAEHSVGGLGVLDPLHA